MFRPAWRDTEVPWRILGSRFDNGVHYLKVRLFETGDSENPNAYENITDANTVVVQANVFGGVFPQLMIQYYQENLSLYGDSDSHIDEDHSSQDCTYGESHGEDGAQCSGSYDGVEDEDSQPGLLTYSEM